jgi:hypothetical protein
MMLGSGCEDELRKDLESRILLRYCSWIRYRVINWNLNLCDMKYVYEVIDSTDDERYYPLGVYLSLKEANRAIQSIARKDRAISWIADDSGTDFECIRIKKRKIGWSENGTTVNEIKREQFYNEENDEYEWRSVK